ncbi:hypothetical protein [Methylobacterium oxalidis]|uniref:Uncharacterized protein n=1 Tax=Methylobacterium oxalidis TaxID=944322 RepID=A0A512JB71_9HYPH|nr:hypothetical protein [Methylobacterium oxalidis]GEP07217.1 hypothetical protein MOX02_52550 [Methylobacterium oxalidis]GJE31923.1 hypothetical protein LDDCCGHA_2105 [Methylobacterium oxalidis]GLS67633.1 hypothetical protein GCM10007888_60170 [Methylobacterium oxalidis]
MAAIVLDRLTWWWVKGKPLVKHGIERRAKPRSQLAQECRMSDWQLRSALQCLKAEGLVETSQHKWGGRMAYMHYRLLPKAMVLLPGSDKDPGLVESHTPLDHMVGISSKNPYVSSNEDTTGPLDCASDFSEGFSGEVQKGDKKPVPKNMKISPHSPPSSGQTGGKTASAASAGKGETGKKPTKLTNPLWETWRIAVAQAYPKDACVGPTQKELGQLKQLRNKLPPGTTEQTITKVVAAWLDFIDKARSDAGAFAVPQKPDIGFVLKFAGVAANFKAPAPKACGGPALAAIKQTALLPPKKPEPKPEPIATLEEIMADL